MAAPAGHSPNGPLDRDTDVERAWRYFGGLLSTSDLVPTGSRWCVAMLVDVDDFVVRARSHDAAWASRQVLAVERSLSDVHEDALPISVHRIEPDEWVVVLGAADERMLRRHVEPLAEDIRAAVGALTEVTVTVSYGTVVPPDRVAQSLSEALQAHDRKLVLGGDRTIDGAHGTSSSALPSLDSIEQQLSQRVRQGDRDGAVTLLRRWLADAARLEGLTPELLRRWVAAHVLSALNAAGERRAADGSAVWADVLERATLEDFAKLGTIHERSYLNLWVEGLIDRVVDAPRDDGHPILRLVTDYLDEHYGEDLSLVRVARAVGCSPYYVSHLFQREMDTTFLRYLTAVRMNHARTLLATTDRSIAGIARDVGYGSPRHFRTVFKRTVGVTPTSYRASGNRADLARATG